MTTIVPFAGVVLEQSAVATGFLAAAIAVGGFIARAQGVLESSPEPELQRQTVVGGLSGLSVALLLIIIDVMAG